MEINEYLPTDEVIERNKKFLGISSSNDDMTDEEIVKVLKYIGMHAPDTIWVNGEYVLGRLGISAMLSLTLYMFPDFYERHELSQFN